MVARVTTYRGQVEPLADGIEETRAVLLGKPGALGVQYLLDTRGGVALTISFWEALEAADASSEWARHARERTVAALEVSVEDVHVFDIALDASGHVRP